MSKLTFETDTNPASAARCNATRDRIAGYMGMTPQRVALIKDLMAGDYSGASLDESLTLSKPRLAPVPKAPIVRPVALPLGRGAANQDRYRA